MNAVLSAHPVKPRDLLICILIVFAAALMRFSQPGVVEFFHDDAMLSTLAQEMVSGERFPLTGINSSVGIPNPPTSVYMMALPFLFDSNPATAIGFVMALNTAGVSLLWFIAHRYFGRTVALLAGLGYALSPWAVLYSRKIWAQEFHTPLVLLGFLLALYGFLEHRPPSSRRVLWLTRHEWAQAGSLPVLLFAFQIHFAAWALLPVWLVIVWIGRQHISWRAIPAAVLLAGLVLLPYAIGLSQTLQSDPTRISDAAQRSDAATGLAFTTQPLVYLTYLATGLGLETWIAPAQQEAMLQAVPSVSLWWILGGLALLGTVLLLRRSQRNLAPALLLWAYLPAVALIPRWTDVYPHYFIASIPVLVLLTAIGAGWLVQLASSQPLGRTIMLAAILFLLLTQGIYWRGVLRFVDQTEITYPGFTVPLHYLHEIEAELAPSQDVIVLSQGMAWDLHHESAVWPILLRDNSTCIRTLVGDGYAVFPAHPFAVLQTPDMPANAVMGLYFNAAPVLFPTRPGSPGYAVYHWEEAPAWDATPLTPIPPVRFEGDVQLTGYHLQADLLLLEWLLPQRSPGLNYQYSGQFYDAQGAKIGQHDTVFWHGRHWCAGDRLLTWMRVTVPEQTAALHVYLYRLGDARGPQYINAQTLDTAGLPNSDHAEIIVTTP